MRLRANSFVPAESLEVAGTQLTRAIEVRIVFISKIFFFAIYRFVQQSIASGGLRYSRQQGNKFKGPAVVMQRVSFVGSSESLLLTTKLDAEN